MKSIILYANEDEGFEQRLDAALCLSSQHDCLVKCVQVTPFNAFIIGDPFGGIYALPTAVEQIGEAEAAHRLRVEDRLRRHRVRWDWENYEGNPGHVLVERSRLADVVVVSLPDRDSSEALSMAAGLAIGANTPILALPIRGKSFTCNGDALIAWNGSNESALALRSAVPLLKRASQVHLVAVATEKRPLPHEEATHYLLQHGVHAKFHPASRRDESVAEALMRTASDLGAHYIVAGAYGHSRLRETLLGGVTSELIAASEFALILAH